MTVAFVTLGCKVNQVDSGALRQRMEAAGYDCVEPEETPDVLVINSCAVTAESERKTRQKLHHFRALYHECVLVLTGCAVQAGKADAYPEADIVLGHRDIGDFARYIDEFSRTKARAVCVSQHQRDEAFCDSAHKSIERTRAHLKIEDGCDRFCAYCIIPHARGHVRSMPLEAMRRELENFDAQGFREIVLVGINLAAYGSDLGCGLGDAMSLFSDSETFSNIQRVRLGSLEPDLLTPTLISKMANTTISSKIKLCPHFHVSLQSGCDSVLKRMGRLYSAEEYFTLIKRLRAYFPGAAVTTDVMVGFPGESEAEFEASLAFARAVGFAKMHVFPFSARPGTAAAAMPGQVPRALKQARAKKMLTLAQECHTNFLNSQIGSVLEVLPEEEHPAG
ncbi:MAG: MiaB/RimO family radical SAM methylthiotransferase, partial [Firmicutes bacterium]|nr:MiaB/RimO family radical SAM methylthiotransferase [Bacillota bacterium]